MAATSSTTSNTVSRLRFLTLCVHEHNTRHRKQQLLLLFERLLDADSPWAPPPPNFPFLPTPAGKGDGAEGREENTDMCTSPLLLLLAPYALNPPAMGSSTPPTIAAERVW